MPNMTYSSTEEKIITARISLLLKKPFFGNMATRLILKESTDIPTAAVDGKHLWYNKKFIDEKI